jgi:hypothetical protein
LNAELWQKIGFAALCVAIPITWGWLMHMLFEHFRRRPNRPSDDQHDYTI